MTAHPLAADGELNAHLHRPVRILLVEDSPSDRALAMHALREARVSNELHTVADGEAAIAFLRQAGEYETAPRPDLVILDLNLPKKDGREVLAELKDDRDLRSIPVIVLTTSAADEDVLAMYELQAAGYITKPVAFGEFVAAVRGIEEFWLSLVRLPRS